MIVDEVELRRQTFEDDELLREIVGLFILETPQLVAAMEVAGGAARAEIAHRLKGSALALGAHDLVEAASRIEQEPDDAGALLDAGRLADEAMNALRAIAGLNG